MQQVRLVEGATLRRLSRAREFIEAKHAEPITLDAIAESAGLSPFHFCGSFATCSKRRRTAT